MHLTELENEVLKLDHPPVPDSRRFSFGVWTSCPRGQTLWLDEAGERSWDAGEVEGISAEQVMRELRSGSE